MPNFAARLQQKIREHSPLCVGLDPSAALLRACNLPDTPQGALDFGRRVLEAADYELSIIKPQSAFFERFGSAGFAALEALVSLARSNGVLVLLDGKRGDIDTTAAAYAEGCFSAATSLRVDAMTTHAYLGFRALEPLLEIAVAGEGGVFVVVRSSNPEGRELQCAKLTNGETVVQGLSREITDRNRQFSAAALGPIGAVVGATCEDAAQIVADLPHSFILAPGVGAQGATMQDVIHRMPTGRGRVLPSVSRAILARGSGNSEIKATIRGLQNEARELL
jgi:orotidine-5'-phosphate decarboxylase